MPFKAYVHVSDSGFTEKLMILKYNWMEEEYPNKINMVKQWVFNFCFVFFLIEYIGHHTFILEN